MINKIILGIGGLIGIAIMALLLCFPVMWLWNWLMPVIFGLCEINVFQALGLLLLSSIFFKSSSGKD